MEMKMNNRPLNRVRMTTLMMGVHGGLLSAAPVPWWGADESDLVLRNVDATAEVVENDLILRLPDDYPGDVRQDEADLIAEIFR